MDHGAHFYRTDLQVHSSRDRGWTGAARVTDEERKQYVTSLVRACRQKRLQAIAITDHHDLLLAKFVRAAARAERDNQGNPLPPEQQLVVFPGMELTLSVPCQAILVFDADFPDDLFSLVLTALAISPSKDTDAKTAETRRLRRPHGLIAQNSGLEPRNQSPSARIGRIAREGSFIVLPGGS